MLLLQLKYWSTFYRHPGSVCLNSGRVGCCFLSFFPSFHRGFPCNQISTWSVRSIAIFSNVSPARGDTLMDKTHSLKWQPDGNRKLFCFACFHFSTELLEQMERYLNPLDPFDCENDRIDWLMRGFYYKFLMKNVWATSVWQRIALFSIFLP